MAAANVVEQVRAVNIFSINEAEQEQYAGRVEEFMPARLQVLTSEHHAGGMDSPVYLDMGMETPVARFVVNGFHGQLINTFGLANANQVRFIARGALEDYNGDTRQITFKMRGNVVDMPFGRLRGRGSVPKMVIEITCTLYEVYIGEIGTDGTEHVYIDVLNMIRRIGGVDRLEKLRQAIGITAIAA